ncbi:MAG: hypothetical protein ACREFI_12910 [Stellaceae bacterium]
MSRIPVPPPAASRIGFVCVRRLLREDANLMDHADVFALRQVVLHRGDAAERARSPVNLPELEQIADGQVAR